jgi:hypothetical protein
MFDEALRAYSFAPSSEPNLTNPAEVQDVIWGLKAGKAPGPNGISNNERSEAPSAEGFFPSW